MTAAKVDRSKTARPAGKSPDGMLIRRAHAASKRAYAPYSRYQVGAALLCADGTVFDGCNVENASYPLCLCAERTALCSAVAAGQRKFTVMCVSTASSPPASPCGACRQVMMELGPRMRVILCNRKGETLESSVAALLPLAFDGTQLTGRAP